MSVPLEFKEKNGEPFPEKLLVLRFLDDNEVLFGLDSVKSVCVRKLDFYDDSPDVFETDEILIDSLKVTTDDMYYIKHNALNEAKAIVANEIVEKIHFLETNARDLQRLLSERNKEVAALRKVIELKKEEVDV